MKQDIRVQMTKRMLKEGLLKSLSSKPLSMITVSNLCKESGVNRATFYNHYDTPASLLRDIANDYADKLREIYNESCSQDGADEEKAVLACLKYLYGKKEEVKLLLSRNSENALTGFFLDIVHDNLIKTPDSGKDKEEALLEAVVAASATYGLLKVWLLNDIKKTPEDIISMLKKMVGRNLSFKFSSAE